MNQEQICQVTTRDEKWVPTKERVKISTTNVRLETIVPQKEETLQVIINVIKNATCYKAFTIFAEVPKIFMQQFWYTIKKVSGINSYEFLLANKKCLVDAEVFQKILDICPRVQGVDIAEVPDNTTLTFLLDLGYKDTPEAAVDVSEESDSASARKKTTSRRVIKKKVIISTNDNIIPDPYVALELGKSINLTEAAEEEAARQLKVVQSLTPEEQLAADTMKALKESKKTNRRQPGTRGSSKGTGVSLGVPDESTVVPATLSEGTGTKLGVLDEEKVTSEDNVILEWGSEQQSEYTKEEDDDETIEWTNDEETDDEFVHGEEHVQGDDEEKDEFVHDDEQVNDDEDEEMTNSEIEESGNGDEEITDAAKVDAGNTEEVNDDAKKA
ncbi:hypothetical protein Tco_0623446 [Tanacetum coccineum]